MSTYVSNRNGGGQTDEQGHYRFQTKVWQGSVLSGFAVSENSPLARNVLVSAGDIKIDYNAYAYTAWSDANITVPIATADTTNPRLDRIVAYIDRSLTSGGTNNPGYLKCLAVAGTPGASPVKTSDANVQTAVTAAAGAVASPWVELAVVRVEANATTIPNSKITDTRVMLTALAGIVNTAAIIDAAVTAAKIAAAAVNLSKLATGSLTLGFNTASNAGLVIPTAWTTYNTVVATSTGNPVELDVNAYISDGSSGSGRTGHIRVLCDGADINSSGAAFSSDRIWGNSLSGQRMQWSEIYRHTPAAGSHTWAFQVVADTSSASILLQTSLKVREVK